ncbi:hypothetical protein GCM10028808_10480 [Spirosoma migulaei]
MPFPRLEFRLTTSVVSQGVYTPVTVVIEEPVKWSDVRITAERDPDFHGFNYEYSDGKVQLDFTCESAANLLSAQYYTYGNDAVVKFLIVDIAADGSETVRYSGKIDFNDVDIQPGRVSADVIRDDLHEKINARWDTPVSMTVAKTLDNSAITPPLPIEISLPGQAVTDSGYFKRIGPFYDESSFENPDFTGHYTLFPNLVNPNGQPNQPTGAVDPITNQPVAAPPELSSLSNSSGQILIPNGTVMSGTGVDIPFLDGYADSNYHLKTIWLFRLNIIAYKKALQIGGAKFLIWDINPLLTIVRPNQAPEIIALAARQQGQDAVNEIGERTFSCQYNGDFYAPKGTKIYLNAQIRAIVNARKIIFLVTTLQAQVEIERISRAVDSTGYAFMLPDALKHVFGVVSNALSGGTGNISGSLISKASVTQAQDGYGTEYAVSSGYQLRNLNTKAPTFTLKQLLGTLSAQHVAGMLYQTDSDGNHSVRVEDGRWFYRGGRIMILDEVPTDDPTIFNYSEKPNKDLLINQVIVGYEKYPETGPGALLEFNTERTYQTPIITNNQPKEIKCPLIAAGSAIEEARRLGIPQYDATGKPIDRTTEGGTYDNDAFLLHVAPKSFSGGITFAVIPFFGFPYKEGQPAAKTIQLPDSAEPLKVGDTIIFSGTGTPNDGVEYLIGYVTVSDLNKLIYSVSNLLPMVPGAFFGSWTLKNQPVRIRTNERLTVYGVTDPATTYNLELSPARMLRRWAWWLNSGLRYKKPTEELRCTDYKGNRDMQSRVKDGYVLPGDTAKQVVYETGDIALGEYEYFEKLFSPEVIPARVYMTPEQADETLLALRNLHADENLNMGYLTIRNPDGTLVDGFPFKIDYNPTSGIAELLLWKKNADLPAGGPSCVDYANWVYQQFINNPGANPDLYRFCTFGSFKPV